MTTIGWKIWVGILSLSALVVVLWRRIVQEQRLANLANSRYRELEQYNVAKEKLGHADSVKLDKLNAEYSTKHAELQHKQDEIIDAATEGAEAIAQKWAAYLARKK